MHSILLGLSAWIESCYSQQSLLLLGSSTIKSCCGVQQGDPLGPLGFALTLQPLVERIKSEVASLHLNAWYLDDGTLVGPPASLAAALRGMAVQWGSISIEGSPSCIPLLRPTSRPLPSRPISLLPTLVSLSWVAQLAPLLTVRRCLRFGWKRSRSLYGC